jgi:hypothetical protein
MRKLRNNFVKYRESTFDERFPETKFQLRENITI